MKYYINEESDDVIAVFDDGTAVNAWGRTLRRFVCGRRATKPEIQSFNNALPWNFFDESAMSHLLYTVQLVSLKYRLLNYEDIYDSCMRAYMYAIYKYDGNLNAGRTIAFRRVNVRYRDRETQLLDEDLWNIPDRKHRDLLTGQYAIIERIMGNLPQLSRFCVISYYFEGRGTKEIGEELGLRPKQVYRIIRRTLRKAKEILKRHGIEDF